MTRCARHAAVAATTRCETCGRPWCPPCTDRPPVRGVALRLCPVCEGRGRLRAIEKQERLADFARLLPGVWKYPLRGHGWMVLLGGALIYGLINFAVSMGGAMFPGAVIVVGSFLLTYLWMFYLSIASSSSEGADELPDWPDPVLYVDQRMVPLLRLLVALVFSFAPALVGWLVFGVPALVFLALVGLGLLYLPICILALALGARWIDLSPLVLVPAAIRAGPAYLLACGALVLVLLARWAAQAALGDVPLLGGVAGGLLGSYFLAVQMRIIGLLHRTHAKRMRLT